MSKRKETLNSATGKTMSTLQMWQQQMRALQRASEAREHDAVDQTMVESKEKDTARSESKHGSTLIYPHLP